MVKGISGRRRGQKEPVLGHSLGFDMMLGGYVHGHGGTVGGRKAGGLFAFGEFGCLKQI